MPSMPKEDDMEPYNGPKNPSMPKGDPAKMKADDGEPDMSPMPKGDIDAGKGNKDPNESLRLLGAGKSYQGWY